MCYSGNYVKNAVAAMKNLRRSLTRLERELRGSFTQRKPARGGSTTVGMDKQHHFAILVQIRVRLLSQRNRSINELPHSHRDLIKSRKPTHSRRRAKGDQKAIDYYSRNGMRLR